jgi:hypothetical protein
MIKRYLQSRANMFGSLAAMIVVVAQLLNFLGPNWWLLALGAYVAASLPFLFGRESHDLPQQMHTAEALQLLRDELLPRLPTKPQQVLADILKTVDALMPRLKEMEAQGLVEASSRAMLKQTVTQLLPDAANTYLRLPREYANQVAIDGKKTAQDLLLDQLHMLQEHVHELEANLLSSDVNKLLANGRFLQDKLRPHSSPLE